MLLTPQQRAERELRRLLERRQAAAEVVAPGPDLIPDDAAAATEPAQPEPSHVIEITPADLEPQPTAYDQLPYQHKLFVEAIVQGKTKADAARAAGYEGNYADSAGWRLANVNLVSRAIVERKTQALEDAGINTHDLLTLLADWAFGRKTVDSDAVRLRAAETLLTHLYTPGRNNAASSSVATKIAERFQRARLTPQTADGARNLTLIPGGKKDPPS